MLRWTGVSAGSSPRRTAAAACLIVSPVPVSTEPISGGTSAPQIPVSQPSDMAYRLAAAHPGARVATMSA